MRVDEQFSGDKNTSPFSRSLSRYKMRLRPIGWRATFVRLLVILERVWAWFNRHIKLGHFFPSKRAADSKNYTDEKDNEVLRRYKVHLRPVARSRFWTLPRRVVVGGTLGGLLVLGSAGLALQRSTAPIVTPTPMVLPTRAPLVQSHNLVTPTFVFKPTRAAIATPTATKVISEATPVVWTVKPYPYRIKIPAIAVDAKVVPVAWSVKEVSGKLLSEWEVASYAAGWHVNSARPGQGGNIVIAGHHNIEGEVFRDVVNLDKGDKIGLYSGYEDYEYVVREKVRLLAKGISEEQRRENAQYIEPTLEEQLTLVTCWPYHDNTHRIIILADLEEKLD